MSAPNQFGSPSAGGRRPAVRTTNEEVFGVARPGLADNHGGPSDNASRKAGQFSHSSAGQRVLVCENLNPTYDDDLVRLSTSRARSAAFNYIRAFGSSQSDISYSLRGDGAGLSHASWISNNFGVAQYFEWSDGNIEVEDRIGYTVVLEGDKIRCAAQRDSRSDIIGVVTVRAGFVGNAAWNHWSSRYLTDAFGRSITETLDRVRWEEVTKELQRGELSGNEALEAGEAGTGTCIHDYLACSIPSWAKPPSNAARLTVDEDCPNPEFDPTRLYLPREHRSEWAVVSLLGQAPVRTGEPVGDRWIKLRDVSPDVQEWLIR